jgi:DNA invertase Pin-like site-specific DNA recombinase
MKNMSKKEICISLNISRTTLYRTLVKYQNDIDLDIKKRIYFGCEVDKIFKLLENRKLQR